MAFIVHISKGGGSSLVGVFDVIPILFDGFTEGDSASIIVWKLRVPRAMAAVLAGAILGACGAAFQAYFRNPIAEPYIVGVSSGAGLGGTIALVLGWSQALWGLGTIALAFIGGLLSLWLVVSLARRRGTIQVTTLLLAGVVVGAMLASLMTTVLMLDGHDSMKVLRWLLGSLTPMFTERLWAMAIVLVVGLIVLQTQTRALNAFSVSEFTSERLGVDPKRLRVSVLVTATAMVSVAVGAVGIIGFLGLVAPHIARRVVGLDLRYSLFGSALMGAALLLGADLIAQNLHRTTELHVGAITAVLGAPALLFLLKKYG